MPFPTAPARSLALAVVAALPFLADAVPACNAEPTGNAALPQTTPAPTPDVPAAANPRPPLGPLQGLPLDYKHNPKSLLLGLG